MPRTLLAATLFAASFAGALPAAAQGMPSWCNGQLVATRIFGARTNDPRWVNLNVVLQNNGPAIAPIIGFPPVEGAPPAPTQRYSFAPGQSQEIAFVTIPAEMSVLPAWSAQVAVLRLRVTC
ncbi:hypothetical protein KTR66_14180 [Roseococcus sp. SDR]|uniref:hypothetical protein n=1 Tax=Roseococcus sp. SDR TaxID=2835532 RepID=UPI001BCCED9C|nr:hypothetical protein [Roseococcus sp. SDR]MBS7791147.1 hypothetical protein [Roseococcus sp. SDR]MBV1846461.1 hypothetical protein [Roseococcus sp. SDR]